KDSTIITTSSYFYIQLLIDSKTVLHDEAHIGHDLYMGLVSKIFSPAAFVGYKPYDVTAERESEQESLIITQLENFAKNPVVDEEGFENRLKVHISDDYINTRRYINSICSNLSKYSFLFIEKAKHDCNYGFIQLLITSPDNYSTFQVLIDITDNEEFRRDMWPEICRLFINDETVITEIVFNRDKDRLHSIIQKFLAFPNKGLTLPEQDQKYTEESDENSDSDNEN
ncbi:MAG: hypothetical protein CMK92_05540, partial [Pseudomonas sp.]|nr:hypothetical protein [Pseudomonas sp.]